jgi:hypothetical protein
MDNLTISIFGSKIFLEIINEIKLFSKFNIKFYEDFDLCVKDSQKSNLLAIFFVNKGNLSLFNNSELNNFPSLFITDISIPSDNFFSSEIYDHIKIPLSIHEVEKKIVSLSAKSEFKKNSVIKLNNYVINKIERKIKRNELELQLSEKEIDFLIMFSKSKKPINKDLVLKKVWNYSSETETHTVETHIHRLRKKILLKFGDSDFIKNNKKGYYI